MKTTIPRLWFSPKNVRPALDAIRYTITGRPPRRPSEEELDEAFKELKDAMQELVKRGELPSDSAELILSTIEEMYLAQKVKRSFDKILTYYFEPA